MTKTALQSDLAKLSQESIDSPFDAIIAGGGSAGLTVARTLHELGARVAIVEAGPAPFLTHISNTELRFSRQLLRNLRDTLAFRPPMASGGTFGTNYSCLGGRGLFWNGASPRFSDSDFDGWPADAIPAADDYQWAEHQFRVSTTMGCTPMAARIIARLAEDGFAAEPGPFAVDIDNLVTGRLSAGIASGLGMFLRTCGDAVASGKIRLATESRVDRILIDGKLASGLIVSDPNGNAFEIRARSIVLCAGGLESIKLAGVSGIDDPSDRIGKGIQEHVFYQALLNGAALYDTPAASSAIVHIRSTSQDGHQWELHAPGNRLFGTDDGAAWRPEDTPPYEILIRSFAATEKRDANWLETKPGSLGSSIVHFSLSGADEQRRVAMANDGAKLGNALGAVAAALPGLDSLDRFRPPGSSYHEAGGLDMGTDPLTSVTAPDGSFHHLTNLVCADAAAFPRIGATNPHLTIVACARRKARQLAAHLAI